MLTIKWKNILHIYAFFWNIRHSQGEIWNGSPCTGSKERRKKEANHFVLMGGRFNKKVYLHTSLVLDDHKKNKSPYSPVRIFKVCIEVLSGFSHVFCSDGLNNTLLFQGHVLETISTVGMKAKHTYEWSFPHPSDPAHGSIFGHTNDLLQEYVCLNVGYITQYTWQWHNYC